MTGKLDCLSCGDGHTELRFDSSDPIETERARRTVTTLLRSGCILFIEKEGKTTRVLDFDASTDCYIIADVPEPKEQDANLQKEAKPRKKRATKKVAAKDVDVTAVPIRAGG